jgi:hypothetical protein
VSTEKPTIYEVMSKVMADVQAVGKSSRNQEQGYNFRGVDAVVNAVGPKFREYGVVPVPMLDTASYRDVLTNRGKPSRECTVTVTYRFYGPAGDHVDAIVPGESMDFGDKGAAKAMSVAYRIALLQLLCIPTDEPDADSHTYERASGGEWEAAKPPTEAQTAAYDVLLAELVAVTERPGIGAVGKKCKAALTAGDITQAQYDALDQRAGERIGDLRRAEQEAEKPAEPAGESS